MPFELRIQIAIPLAAGALERAKQVAGFEPHIDTISTAVAEARGDIKVDVVATKPRQPKGAA